MQGDKVGKVEHYYDQIGVAVIKLEKGKLKVGDKIKVADRGENELFEQEVTSMQVDGKNIDEAKKGDDFGMKVDQKVKEGYSVYKQ
jgi:putative protease